MTFLEFVCTKLMGPAVSSDGDGQSNWPCPRHDDPGANFHTLPCDPRYRHRFRCWHCALWGDEFDLLLEFFPGENYGQRRARLAALRIDHKREQPERCEAKSPSSFSPGIGDSEAETTYGCALYDPDERDSFPGEFDPETTTAITELLEYLGNAPDHKALAAMLEVAQRALKICRKYKLHPLGLAGRCGHASWVAGLEHEHLEECKDDDCDAACCRRAAGWTEEEIAADHEACIRAASEERAAKAERREQLRASVREGIQRAIKRNRKASG